MYILRRWYINNSRVDKISASRRNPDFSKKNLKSIGAVLMWTTVCLLGNSDLVLAARARFSERAIRPCTYLCKFLVAYFSICTHTLLRLRTRKDSPPFKGHDKILSVGSIVCSLHFALVGCLYLSVCSIDPSLTLFLSLRRSLPPLYPIHSLPISPYLHHTGTVYLNCELKRGGEIHVEKDVTFYFVPPRSLSLTRRRTKGDHY